MQHSPTYSGCPTCSDEMRSLLSMDSVTYCRWLSAQPKLRAAARSSLKTGINYFKEDYMTDYAPPSPYALQPTAKLKTLKEFEAQWRNDRLRDVVATRRALDADSDAAPVFPHLTTAELSESRAPDPYAAPLAALRAQEVLMMKATATSAVDLRRVSRAVTQ